MFYSKNQIQIFGTTVVLFLAVTGISITKTEPDSLDRYFSKFPAVAIEKTHGPQIFRLEYWFFYRDVYGNTANTIFTTGRFTRSLEGGGVRWNDVKIASAKGPDDPLPAANPLEEMEGFSYAVSEDIVTESFYGAFPNTDLRHLVKTLVWDGVMIDVFDHMISGLESLQLNRFRKVTEFEDFYVPMCDWGILKMKDLKIKWCGLSRKNGELCALIYYRSFSNPVDAFVMKGRSLYWGHVWISVEDKNIECLTLNEDVVLEMPTGTGGTKVMDIQREVRFEKIN